MPALTRTMKHLALVAMLSGSITFGGCGGGGIAGFDGIELQGGVFDSLGIGTNSEKKEKNPQVAARPGLVLPPDPSRLPQPGEVTPEQLAVAGDQAWPVDPEQNKARAKAEAQKRHDEFCEKALRDARLTNKDPESVVGPNGSCKKSIFGSGLLGVIEGKKQ